MENEEKKTRSGADRIINANAQNARIPSYTPITLNRHLPRSDVISEMGKTDTRSPLSPNPCAESGFI